jgi:hypothetical protein
MGLKCRVKTVISVNYKDLEHFIESETGHEYDISENEEVSNDTARAYNVDYQMDKFMAKAWAEFKAGSNKSYILNTILCGLCSEGKIHPGEYLICVSW